MAGNTQSLTSNPKRNSRGKKRRDEWWHNLDVFAHPAARGGKTQPYLTDRNSTSNGNRLWRVFMDGHRRLLFPRFAAQQSRHQATDPRSYPNIKPYSVHLPLCIWGGDRAGHGQTCGLETPKRASSRHKRTRTTSFLPLLPPPKQRVNAAQVLRPERILGL
ncbi:hypothetical protein N658DRAFT_64485 [Parathielavia hyrcaniae]|uniref:Uncharacterized protein n=1 Tax=Parathielavia hyrcaniae TaxID=113614 RepID=A0AAN6T1P9_9PEZI|nr:hypothetical protein N658DRAFT_64485 [Parathielavia hyrcaniae]